MGEDYLNTNKVVIKFQCKEMEKKEELKS